jgi:hypothetical protein
MLRSMGRERTIVAVGAALVGIALAVVQRSGVVAVGTAIERILFNAPPHGES